MSISSGERRLDIDVFRLRVLTAGALEGRERPSKVHRETHGAREIRFHRLPHELAHRFVVIGDERMQHQRYLPGSRIEAGGCSRLPIDADLLADLGHRLTE